MNIYLQYIVAIGVIGLSVGNFITSFGKGARGSTGEMIDFYKKESENYKDMMGKKEAAHGVEMKEMTEKFSGQVNDLTRQVGELQGQYNAEKKQREQYELILKDKNPETEAFMKLVIKSCDDQGKVNKEVVESLTKMSEVLKEVYTMVKSEHDR